MIIARKLDAPLAPLSKGIMSHRGVCIAHQQANDQPGLLDLTCLQEAGYTTRDSSNCVPDLVISKAGTTAAFLLVANQDLLGDTSNIWRRCSDHQVCQPTRQKQHN